MFSTRNEEILKYINKSDYIPGTALERLQHRYPHVKAQFLSLYGTVKCEVYLKSIMLVDRDNREGFEPWVIKAVEELLDLNSLKMKKVESIKNSGLKSLSETQWGALSKFI